MVLSPKLPVQVLPRRKLNGMNFGFEDRSVGIEGLSLKIR